MDEPISNVSTTSKDQESIINAIKSILLKEADERTDLDINKILDITQNVKFFKALKEESSDTIHKECCASMTYEFFSENQNVFNHGERGNKFYILLYGAIGVQIPILNPETQVPEFQEVLILRDGSSFGELALLEKKPRAATIKCKEDSHFAVLDKSSYQRILSKLMNEKKQEIVNFLKKLPLFER